MIISWSTSKSRLNRCNIERCMEWACPSRSSECSIEYNDGAEMNGLLSQLARMVRVYESALSERLMNKDNENERSFGFWSPAVGVHNAFCWRC